MSKNFYLRNSQDLKIHLYESLTTGFLEDNIFYAVRKYLTQWHTLTFSMHLRRVLIFLTHQPIPIALNSDHWGSPLWIAGIILISSSSASEWKAQAKWQVDTPKLETQNNKHQNSIKTNKNNFLHTHVFIPTGKNFQAEKKVWKGISSFRLL